MDWLIKAWASEPVVITAIVDAVIALAVALGLPVTDQVKVAIDGLIVAVGVLIARSQSTSPATVAATAAANVVALNQAATFRAPPAVTK